MNKETVNSLMVITMLTLLLSACDAVEVEQQSGPTLCYEYYRQCVSPILQSQNDLGMGCADSTCHSVGSTSGGNLKIDTTGNVDSFFSVKSLINILEPASSHMLVYPPLPDHPGVGLSSAFLDTGNRCYLEVLAWASNPKDDPYHVECELNPVCIVPTDAATDC